MLHSNHLLPLTKHRVYRETLRFFVAMIGEGKMVMFSWLQSVTSTPDAKKLYQLGIKVKVHVASHQAI